MGKAYKLNSEGAFYVADYECVACMMPEEVAPELMGFNDAENHCYFKKQPVTVNEIENAIEAIDVSCCSALRYCGTDTNVIDALRERKLDGQIDNVS